MTKNCHFACPTCATFPLEMNGKGFRCTQCGTEYRTWDAVPLLFPKDEISAFVNGARFSLAEVRQIYDKAYQYDGLMGTDLDRAYDEVTKTTLLSFAQPLHNRRLLDLGAGVGSLWQYVPDDVHGYAIDLSPVGMAKARQRFPGLVVGAAVGEHLPFPGDYFDVIISADTIEHTFDPERTLSEVRRVLRPQGVFAASFPIPDSLRKWGWNQIVSRKFHPRFLFDLGRVILRRMRLFGKATFQPIDRDLDEQDWLDMLETAGFTVRRLLRWPEPPQAPIVYLVHAVRAE